MWNAESGTEVHRLEGHRGRVFTVSWSPDGRRLASASIDQTVWVWDAESGAEVRRLEGHTDCVYDVSWSPDGRWLASAAGRRIYIWDAGFFTPEQVDAVCAEVTKHAYADVAGIVADYCV